jgi:hypothetical protein
MGFEMKVSLPRDPRYVATARLIAAESAREAGCDGAPAEAFAGRVEDAARTCLSASHARHVMMAVEREPNALVVTIDHHVMRLSL